MRFKVSTRKSHLSTHEKFRRIFNSATKRRPRETRTLCSSRCVKSRPFLQYARKSWASRDPGVNNSGAALCIKVIINGSVGVSERSSNAPRQRECPRHPLLMSEDFSVLIVSLSANAQRARLTFQKKNSSDICDVSSQMKINRQTCAVAVEKSCAKNIINKMREFYDLFFHQDFSVFNKKQRAYLFLIRLFFF